MPGRQPRPHMAWKRRQLRIARLKRTQHWNLGGQRIHPSLTKTVTELAADYRQTRRHRVSFRTQERLGQCGDSTRS